MGALDKVAGMGDNGSDAPWDDRNCTLDETEERVYCTFEADEGEKEGFVEVQAGTGRVVDEGFSGFDPEEEEMMEGLAQSKAQSQGTRQRSPNAANHD